MGGNRPDILMDSFYNLYYKDGASQLDGVPSELSEIFNPHWGTFPPQHPLLTHVVCVTYCVLWTMSFFGNLLIIYIFLKASELRSPTNMFICNLALADLCMITSQTLPCIFNCFYERYWVWGVLGCQVYACVGGIFGTVSLLTMVVIGYDRYNVIVKGFSGVKITSGKAFVILLAIWAYSTLVCVPPFFGWGGYAAEGLLITCSYDYLAEDFNRKSFMAYAFIGNYCIPMMFMAAFYVQIVKAVVAHEAALKAQAKKMNVDSLRSGDQSGESAEFKIAKVAVTNVLLLFCIWTPYALVVVIACFYDKKLVTPLVAQIPSYAAKTASAFNPSIYATSHPKFRAALAKHCPSLGIGMEFLKPSGEGEASATTRA